MWMFQIVPLLLDSGEKKQLDRSLHSIYLYLPLFDSVSELVLYERIYASGV